MNKNDKFPTSKKLWAMYIHIGLDDIEILFDGKKAFDPLSGLPMTWNSSCGITLYPKQLGQVAAFKMERENLHVVYNVMYRVWQTEPKDTPWSCSVQSETYWCS